MSEMMFVIKAFALAIVLTMAMQAKVGNFTIEEKAQDLLYTSSLTRYLQNVSSGAVLMIRNASKSTSDYISQKLGNDSETQKASRLNFDIKRSQPKEKQ